MCSVTASVPRSSYESSPRRLAHRPDLEEICCVFLVIFRAVLLCLLFANQRPGARGRSKYVSI